MTQWEQGAAHRHEGLPAGDAFARVLYQDAVATAVSPIATEPLHIGWRVLGVIILGVIFLGLIALPLAAAMIADLTWRQVVVLSTAAMLLAGYIVVRNSDTFQTMYWRWTMPEAPASETAFITAAEKLHALRVRDPGGSNDLAALRQAEATLCALPSTVAGWNGRVEQAYLTDSNQGESLAVAIWPHIVVRTALFPDATGTLIPADTPAFGQVHGLRPGDAVRFDGRIVGHAGACPGDPPINRNEKLRDPEFLLAFSKVEPVGHH
jgi:hypothetical protein